MLPTVVCSYAVGNAWKPSPLLLL